MKLIERIMEQEVDKMVNRLNLSTTSDVKNVLNELFSMTTHKLMDNIGSVEANEHNQIAKENWDQFVQTITSSIHDEKDLWLENISDIKLKILTFKYFTKKDLMKVENIESSLRMDIKPYFTALQNYVTLTDFRHKVLTLPAEMLFNIVRYLFHISPDLNKSIVVKNPDLRDNVTRLITLRMKTIRKINDISKGYQNLLDFRELKELFDCGVMFEDNYLNRAVCEFVVKMTNHSEAAAKLQDLFPGAILKDLKNQAENTSAYIQHTNAIKTESGVEFFTTMGEQVGTRLENQIELVREAKYDGYVVDNESRFKEPNDRVKSVSADNIPGATPMVPTDGEGGVEPTGAAGGAGAGGGDALDGSIDGDLGLGNADFAAPGEEGQVPGEALDGEVGIDDTGEVGAEPDGTPVEVGDDGLPAAFGTEEDNTPDPEKDGTK